MKTKDHPCVFVSDFPDVETAWLALQPHWMIQPSSKPLPRTPVYSALRMFLSPLLRPLLRWRIRGAEHIPRKGATILAANHLSHIDPIAVIAAARRTTHYLAKDGHFSNPLTSFVMRATGQIETHREAGGSDALASAATILDNGCALGIFPEGTRSKRTESPFLLPGKTGVARLAAAYPHAVVVPLALVGTREVMQPQHHKFPRLWRRFDVNAAKGITWIEWLASEQGGNQSASALVELSKADEHEIRAELSRLYRRFTDQLMGTLAATGAP
jgi:1-acyl-sn-glycerol-3-phosphate acyltransferase